MNPLIAQKYPAFPPVDLPNRQWPSRRLTSAPQWCSVDLRDGNQALIEPMNLDEKLELFQLLVRLGFKEIEVAFPSASEVEFAFVRKLIDDALIPDDVTIQVLTQAREHLIRRTFEAIDGAPRAIVHLYNSTSPAQRRVVFNMTEDQIVEVAVEATRLIKQLASSLPRTKVAFEYSPESFTSTELPFSLRICEAVMGVWEPTAEDKIILNLPATVEVSTPNVYADQIEWMLDRLPNREAIILSVHTHNDRGCAVAAAELGQLAGADRVEGTILGYGERTGNVDLVTLGLNLMSHGIDPGLDLTKIPQVIEVVQRCTDEVIHPRHPYVGELVYTAFSGSHQDAISKGLKSHRPDTAWDVPYLLIDPKDIGREYEGIIRVNSQSGKGGVAYVLRAEYGLDIPKAMQPEFSKIVQQIADKSGRELKPDVIYDAFASTYLTLQLPLALGNVTITSVGTSAERVHVNAVIEVNGRSAIASAEGVGPMDAFANALRTVGVPDFRVVSFHEHSLSLGIPHASSALVQGSNAQAAAYVCIESEGRIRWGAGVDPSITMASLRGLISALNR
jgi:2-isopropylmalate synthase